MRLFGLMVVRNAADLLPVSIPHHLAQGVERFLVLDHSSTDATAALLRDFAALGVLEWSSVDGPFRKETWINELALEAYAQGADWVIPIDADEFWTANDGGPIADLVASSTAAAVEARIVHFIQQVDQLESTPAGLLRMVYRVGEPNGNDLPPFLSEASSPKWISRAGAGLWIDRGNHHVEGLTGPTEATSRIVCLHAPVRSRAALLDRQRPLPALDPARKPGESWHLERWKELGPEPAVVDLEWHRNSARGDRIVASGLALEHDTRLRDAIQPWVEGRGLSSPPSGAAAPPRPRTERETALRDGLRHLRQRLQERSRQLAERDLALDSLRREWTARDLNFERLRTDLAARELALERLRRELAARADEISPAELAVWRSVQTSRTFRLWMGSIRLRRILALARPAPAERVATALAPTDAQIAMDLAEQGFAGPLRLFTAEECRRLLGLLRANLRPARDWGKDGAVSSRAFYEIAARPSLARVAQAALGTTDVVLWGAGLIQRLPGEVHPWHSDIESSAPEGGAISVWIALENVIQGNALRIVPRSHRFGVTIQEVYAGRGLRRGEASTPDVERWARDRDARSGVTGVDMVDGDALFFDGRLWHGSSNETGLSRTALLLQYARASYPIRIPATLETPFRSLDEPRPPCLVISGGTSGHSANRVANPPPRSGGPGGPPLPPLARPIDLTSPTDLQTGWKPYHLFRGATPNLGSMSCHFSVLGPQRCPHPPHQHVEEELLLVLDGEAELVLVDGSGREERRGVRRGDLAYYPPGFLHTLRTPASASATYLMFKWTGRVDPAAAAMPPCVLSSAEFFGAGAPGGGGFVARRLFEAPTLTLERLHCHATTLAPGAGYEPHRDDHDVAIVLLAGEVEALGERVTENGVLFAPAGELHGMLNPGATPARYLVFEFHGRAPHAVDATGFEFFESGPFA